MRFLDDLSVGDLFTGGPVTVTAESIKAFASSFDPQAFHLDETAAEASLFRGLAASGWHTAAMTMRMIVDGGADLAAGYVGLGIEEMSWPTAVRPGDTLRIESEILAVRPSATNPTRGIVRMRTTTFNQAGAVVQRFTANLLVPRRAAES